MSRILLACSSVCVMGLFVLTLAAIHADAIPCSQAIATLMPCRNYLVGQASSITIPCCQGALALNSMVRGKPELMSLCTCLKQAAAGLGVMVDRAKALPGACNVQVPVPIDPDMDCTRI